MVQEISIIPGLVYEGQKFQNIHKKVYYSGEVICSNIPIQKLSFCEHIIGENSEQLLIRPIELYELSYSNLNSINSQTQKNLNTDFKLTSITLSKSSSVIRNKRLSFVMPALFINTSIAPNSSMTCLANS